MRSTYNNIIYLTLQPQFTSPPTHQFTLSNACTSSQYNQLTFCKSLQCLLLVLIFCMERFYGFQTILLKLLLDHTTRSSFFSHTGVFNAISTLFSQMYISFSALLSSTHQAPLITSTPTLHFHTIHSF